MTFVAIGALWVIYKNSKYMSLTSRVCAGMEMTWSKTLDLHLPSCHTQMISSKGLDNREY